MDATSKQTGASKEAIQFHYDTGNDFYELFLDQSMTYSCALWEKSDEDLETAQQRKLDYHIREAAAAHKKAVLDIGCGWGGLMFKLRQEFGVDEVDGLTLSEAQLGYIQEKNVPGVSTYLETWQNFVPQKKYGAIISIGAFEHFAHLNMSKQDRIARYREFFMKCHEWLEPGCYVSLQTIGCGNMLRTDFSEFFAQKIFPESDLPRLGEIAEAAECLFEIERIRNDREQYGRTTREWLLRLQKNKDKAIAVAGIETYERFTRYLKLIVIGFEIRKSMNLYRLTLKRIDQPRSYEITD